MKKTIAFGIVFLLVVMSFTSISGIQIDKNIIIPSSKGDILYVGGSGEGNYSKIQDAIDNASDGDTVFVFDDSSPYYETLWVNNSINLIGEDRDTTVIDGNKATWFTVKILKSLVNVSGFTINNGNLHADTPDGVIISDNHFINYDGGIVFWDADNSLIISNTFTNCDCSILLEHSRNVRVSDNNFIWNTSGGGQYYDSNEIWSLAGSGNVISNNTFINPGKYMKYFGVFFTESGSTIIKGNLFEGYDTAIGYMYSAYNIRISNNNFIDNNCAISGFRNTRITNNNFLNNKQDVDSYIGYIIRNNFLDGNYWDEWIGLKYPKLDFLPYISYELLGSIPYGFVIDWHPAKEPYNYTSTQGCGIE